MAGSSGGKIAEAGDGASSRIFAVITHTDEPVMPPKGERLAKKDADLIRSWIDDGLLENQSSKARVRSGPRLDLSVKLDPGAKPDGPPPMPSRLSLEPVAVARRASAVADLACSPWAPLLAVAAQKQVLLYNTDTLALAGILPFPKGQPEVLSFHPSGKYLLAGGGIGGKSGTTVTWDVTTGEVLMTIGREFDAVLAAGLRPDLGAVALGGPARLIKLWDPATGEQTLSIKKHTDWITSLAYSPDGVLLATGDRNGGVWVWEARSGSEFHTLRAHQKGVTTVAWRADSNLLATASEDGQVLFWEMNNGKQVKKITAHSGGVLSFDYARDGRFATSGRDRRVKIWKADFKLLKELPAFDELVLEVALTRDGTRLFTADWNGRIHAWDTKTFADLGELSANPPAIATRIKSAEEKLAAAATAKDQSESREKSLRADLTRWRAEAVNVRARDATARHRLLAREQDDAHAAFKDLSQQSAALRKELKQADGEAKESELAAKLAAAAEELQTLRADIDRRAPELIKHQQQAESLDRQYLELTEGGD